MSGSIVKDATVRVGIEVDSDITSAAQKVLAPIERAAQNAYDRLGSVATAAGQAFSNVVMDVARVATAMNTIDLGSQVSRYVRYREEVSRTAAAVGTSWHSLVESNKAVGDRLAISDETVSRFRRGLQQSTYDARDSSRAIAALGDEALSTNRSLDQMAPIGEALHDQLGQSFDAIPDALGRVRAVADALGTTGGPAALQAQIANLGAAIAQFSVKTKGDVGDVLATVGELGRGLQEKQQERVQQRVIGRILSDTEGLRRQLGVNFEQFYDDNGQIPANRFPELIQNIQQMAVKRWGLRAQEVLSQPQNFGDAVSAAAVMAFDPTRAHEAASAPLSIDAAARSRQFRESAVGQDIAERARAEEEKRDDVGGPLADIQRRLHIEGHPILSSFLASTGGMLAGGGLKWLFKRGAGGALEGVAGSGGGGGASPIGRVVAGGLRLAGGGSAGAGLGALGATFLTTLASAELTSGFNRSIGPHREALTNEFEQARVGRVYAIVRAAERASSEGFSPEGYRDELGPQLMGAIRRDPSLQLAAAGAASGQVPHALETESPRLAEALRDALQNAQLTVQLQIQDDTGSPHRVVAMHRGARQ